LQGASFWGRNTSLQQFLARMELPPHEGGINELTFGVSEGNLQTFFLQDTKNMQKLNFQIMQSSIWLLSKYKIVAL
jgi:hypothetical protein